MEYLVNTSKRRAFWSLNEDILKIYYSDYQYAVSIKEDTSYPRLHSPKTTKERRSIRLIQKKSIRRIEDIVSEYSGRYQAWSLLQETPIRHFNGMRLVEDSELKDEALRNKVIMEGLISDDESCIDCWKRWKSHEIYYHNYDEEECENKTHEEGHELCSIKTRKVPVCQIKRYKKIKYSFKDEEEYVAIKADEYDDLTITSEEDCRSTRKLSDDD
ncbi:hypothetical protein Tco_0226181 [Tanacetum coccineum]